jgi:hypothetical protein
MILPAEPALTDAIFGSLSRSGGAKRTPVARPVARPVAWPTFPPDREASSSRGSSAPTSPELEAASIGSRPAAAPLGAGRRPSPRPAGPRDRRASHDDHDLWLT